MAPQSSMPLCLLAFAYQHLGRFEDALGYAERALAVDPEDDWGLRLRSSSLRYLRRAKESVAPALAAAKLSPDDPLVLYNLAHAQLQSGRIKDCQKTTERLLALAPEEPLPYEMAALLAAKKRRWREEEKSWRKALSFNPNDGNYHNNVGLSLFHQKKVRESIEHFRSALLLDPTRLTFQMNAEVAIRKLVSGHVVDAWLAAFLGFSMFSVMSRGDFDADFARFGVQNKELAAWIVLTSTIGFCALKVRAWRRARRELSPTLASVHHAQTRLDWLLLLVGSGFGLVMRLVLAMLLSVAVAGSLSKYTRLAWLLMLVPLWLGVLGFRAYKELKREMTKRIPPKRIRLLGRTRRDLILRLGWLALLSLALAAEHSWVFLLVPVVAGVVGFGYRFKFGYDEFEH